jgi:hypothetical protein
MMQQQHVADLIPLVKDFLSSGEDDQLVLRVVLHTKLPRLVGVTQEVFDHALLFLSSMRCWTDTEIQGPWDTVVRYTIGNADMTKTISYTDDSVVTITTNERGASEGPVVTTLRKEAMVKVGDSIHVTTRLEVQDHSKRQLSKGVSFSNIVVEKKRTYTYTSSCVWTYTLALRWTCPGVKHDEEDIETRHMYFCNPPSYHIELQCRPPCKMKDASYLAQSLLCKIRELIAPFYSTLKTTVLSSNDAAGVAREAREADFLGAVLGGGGGGGGETSSTSGSVS